MHTVQRVFEMRMQRGYPYTLKQSNYLVSSRPQKLFVARSINAFNLLYVDYNCI